MGENTEKIGTLPVLSANEEFIGAAEQSPVERIIGVFTLCKK